MIEIFLLRHAETIWDSSLVSGRTENLSLSDEGIVHSLSIGRILREQGFLVDKIYCSSSLRTKQSLLGLKEAGLWKDTPIIYSDSLQEVSQGEWEGKERRCVMTERVIAEMRIKGVRFMPPGGEAQKDAAERIYNYIAENILNSNLQKVMVVGHANLFRCLMYRILGFDEIMVNKIGFDNLSLTKLRFGEDGFWRLDYLNRIVS
ncbi:histidine phosphatase family protein [Bacteroides helcogenes]|uniref:Phosphoglycerate mutase n=1 Tax=Bacteroides helcogenes (strain ATCC 35417 / DSM 20613 / JCM 6297 / CCUG 15421 / P 36-108) TaxID=693979 RepID=E6SRI3_BACT6|nr:histidine phosphatase family protein [Bacteroides helcogenes]ADV44086.1 Phosphoglycerate mutase [Bacteroides helcogenes P 36-108]